MLRVFSVILEYHMDGRNSSARPTVRQQSLYCMYILQSRHFKANPTFANMFIFIQLNHTSCSLNRARVQKSTDAKLMQRDRNNVFRGF